MNTWVFTLGLCIGAVLSGCACSPTGPAATPAELEPSVRPAIVGLAVYEPMSDVANLTAAVRHVLHPGEPSPAVVDRIDSVSQPLSPAHGPVLASISTTPENEPRPRKSNHADTVLEAWRKYCNDADQITPKEWTIIDSTNMPAELEANWAKDCMPLK